jgi:protein-S-isoprenylcysteine O-methyltransferase Ste14
MMEKLLIILLPLIFLGLFITRNLIVKFRTKQRIRTSDPLVTAAIIITSLSICMTIESTLSEAFYQHTGIIWFLRSPFISYLGLIFFGISFIAGAVFSSHLKESWRVGIPYDQKTELIQSGIYAYIRNPYFLSYFIMFFSLFLIRPSIVVMVLVIAAIFIFHRMVLKEEVYLLTVHAKAYQNYKQKTGRYFPKIKQGWGIGN